MSSRTVIAALPVRLLPGRGAGLPHETPGRPRTHRPPDELDSTPALRSVCMQEIEAYARRLVRGARSRAVRGSDAELTEILERVSARRARRSRVGFRPRQETTKPEGTPGEVLRIQPVAPEVKIISVARPTGFQFRAGQSVKLGVPGGRRASFSITSAPDEPDLEFCIELVPGGRLTPRLFSLEVGDRVEVASRAKGSFTLDPAAACHLMVATVTGIAPFRSMVRDAVRHGVDADFIVLHGASHQDELPYLPEFTAIAATNDSVRYEPTVSRPSAPRNVDWFGTVGRVDDLACRVAANLEPGRTQVYACGNGEMVKRVVAELGSSGFSVLTEVYD
jgi:NAD(P)H-flavin reductase